MHSRIIGFTVMMGIMSSVAFAEPAIQPGDTLESLSKARITTNVNTQTATPTAQTSDANADVKVEDIDPIIGENSRSTESSCTGRSSSRTSDRKCSYSCF